jgi:hypothetical protein
MRKFFVFALLTLLTLAVQGQSFEVSGVQENYKASIGEVIKAPIKFRNTTEKPIILVIRKTQEQIGSTQRNFYCPEGNCLEEKITDYIVRIEPGHTLNNFQVGVEAGLVPGIGYVRYTAFNKNQPSHAVEFDVNFSVEEKPIKENIYQSNRITIRDVYPNPSVGNAFVDYNILSDKTNAKLRIHNIIGNIVGEYELTPSETVLRIRTDELNPGIYFYTLYLDNESVMTRKLIVKK